MPVDPKFLQAISDTRLDADNQPLFAQMLQAVSNTVLMEPLAPLRYTLCATVKADIPIGATSYVWYEMNGVAYAVWMGDYTTELPYADIGMVEHTIKPHHCGNKYHYNFFEARRAVFAGVDLDTSRARFARIGIEQTINKAFFDGVASLNINGFFDLPGVPVADVPDDGTGTSTAFADKTPEQMIRDLFLVKDTVHETTQGIEAINTIGLPVSQMSLIKQTIFGNSGNETVYTWFTKNNPGITLLELPECKGRGVGGTDRMVGWVNDADHICVQIPEPFASRPPVENAFNYEVNCFATYAGIQNFRPLSMAYFDGI